MKINSCRDLKVWQNSIKLIQIIYEIADSLPNDEKYGLFSQIKRAIILVPSNIAEGHTRYSLKEYLKSKLTPNTYNLQPNTYNLQPNT